MGEIIHLKKPLQHISFYEREIKKGRLVGNKCGRDFLYYVLNYHFSYDFNVNKNNPLQIDEQRLFGLPVSAMFAWSQLQFLSLSEFLVSRGLILKINDRTVSGFLSFVSSILFSRMTYQKGIESIELAIRSDITVGVDISLGWGGLLDHVLFVYGYDEHNLYVFDTHKVCGLEYVSLVPGCNYFKLPKSVIKNRWTRFGRVWQITNF